MSKATQFYSLKPADKAGEPFDFSQLKGKVVLIVNVASKCGFTPQYKGLEELYQKYNKDGLEILGFPCNQFGKQEPGSQDEIAEFCKVNYGVSFPVLKKVDVNGSNADAVYEFLKSQKSGFLGFKGIKWNFEKFLIDQKGYVVERWASTTSPQSIAPKIEQLLAKKDDEKAKQGSDEQAKSNAAASSTEPTATESAAEPKPAAAPTDDKTA